MLLALIVMATITLGLLFSGWLTPTPGRAQQGGGGGGSSNENTNCPNYTYTTNVSCPSITNTPVITTPSLCLKVGDPVPDPSYAPSPGASSGGIVITTTETCSNTVTYSTNAITYTFGKIYYNPVKPSGLIAGTYSSECYIGVASSDTNDCPSPGPIDLGSVTWDVLSTNVTKITIDANALVTGIEKCLGYATAATKVVGCSGPAPTVTLSGELDRSYVCCSPTNQGYLHTSGSVTITAGWPQTGTTNGNTGTNVILCPVPGASFPYGGEVLSFGMYIGVGAGASATATIGVAQPCQTEPVCLTYSVNATLAASIQGDVNLGGYFTASAALIGSAGASVVYSADSNGDGNCNYTGNLGKLTADFTVSVKIFGGVTWTPVDESWDIWDGVNIGPYSAGCTCL